MKVAIVSGPRSLPPMGLELAERRLLHALRRRRGDVEIDLRVVGGRSGRRYARSVGARWVPSRRGRAPGRVWRSADLVHLIGLDVPPPTRGRFVATFHDLSGRVFPDEGTPAAWTNEIVERADRLIAVSHFTARELNRMLGVPPHRIAVVPNGPGQDVSPDTPPLDTSELEALGLRAPVVLRMGGYTQRKNVPVLLDAWPEIHRRTGGSLALVGPAQRVRQAQLDAAASLDGVKVLDYLPAELVPRLLRAAAVLASTSTYEGFGLPPLEAMAAGTPVVAVRSGAVEEVCGDAALLVPNEPEALAASVVRAVDDDGLRERMRTAGLRQAAGFTWDKAADAVLAVYRDVHRSQGG